MRKSRILIAPLNWGLGHASRCIPIIQALLELENEVILGGDGDSIGLLIKEFPDLENAVINDIIVEYPSNGSMFIHFLKQYGKVKKQIRDEHNQLQKIISDFNIDAVISDNRYGLYNKNISSVIITHQVNISLPLFGSIVNRIVHNYIRKFDQCWIIDSSDTNSIAGNLSKTDKLANISAYLGPLSRFTVAEGEIKYDVIAILSGPEPHRSILEKFLIQELNSLKGNHLLIRGSSQVANFEIEPKQNIEVHGILDGKSLDEKINASRYIVSRSGYSSIMDYIIKGRKAILIPTPGQSEQEYLAKYHALKGRFIITNQNQPDLKNAISQLLEQPNPYPYNGNNDLKKILEDFCDSLY